MPRTPKKLVRGFTLIELIVASAIGIALIGVVTSSYFHSLAISNKQIKRSVLNSELDGLLYQMTWEIKRAGYCGDCTSTNGYLISDAAGVERSSIAIDDSVTKTTGTCIRFAYNEDSSSGVSSPRDNDARGYRLDVKKGGKTNFEIYRNYGGIANWSCKDGSHWLDFQNDMVKITNFTITREPVISSTNTKKKQNIILSLTGKLGDLTLSRSAKVTVNNVDY